MSLKRCIVAFALPRRQFQWTLEVPAQATVAQVIAAAHAQATALGEDGLVPWNCESLGIFGEPCRREDIPRDGDRIEIYRALLNDPRVSRRARVKGR